MINKNITRRKLNTIALILKHLHNKEACACNFSHTSHCLYMHFAWISPFSSGVPYVEMFKKLKHPELKKITSRLKQYRRKIARHQRSCRLLNQLKKNSLTKVKKKLSENRSQILENILLNQLRFIESYLNFRLEFLEDSQTHRTKKMHYSSILPTPNKNPC